MQRVVKMMEGGPREEAAVMRKGPWMAEEDEVLMDYVKKYGPRDWSSIRSKGLLPRTGKSCRLRWVNKLKPDLKTGCKFSAEEERIVIDLQARFGNKWARIATYLPGRTDNDVKNFWSTRQKRLARILQTPTQSSKSQKNNGKAHVLHHVPSFEAPPIDNSMAVEEEPSTMNQPCQASSYMGNQDVIKMVALPDLINPHLINNLEPSLIPHIELTQVEKKPYTEPPPSQFSFPQLPEPPSLDIPLVPENRELVAGLACDANVMDVFGNKDAADPDTASQFTAGLPFFGLGSSDRNDGKGNGENPATPDSFFGDFPTDMFDFIESIASSSEW